MIHCEGGSLLPIVWPMTWFANMIAYHPCIQRAWWTCSSFSGAEERNSGLRVVPSQFVSLCLGFSCLPSCSADHKRCFGPNDDMQSRRTRPRLAPPPNHRDGAGGMPPFQTPHSLSWNPGAGQRPAARPFDRRNTHTARQRQQHVPDRLPAIRYARPASGDHVASHLPELRLDAPTGHNGQGGQAQPVSRTASFPQRPRDLSEGLDEPRHKRR